MVSGEKVTLLLLCKTVQMASKFADLSVQLGYKVDVFYKIASSLFLAALVVVT